MTGREQPQQTVRNMVADRKKLRRPAPQINASKPDLLWIWPTECLERGRTVDEIAESF